MHLKYIFLLSVFLTSSTLCNAQINVLENIDHCESYTPQIFGYMPSFYSLYCFELPKTQNTQQISEYTFDSEKEILATSHFEFSETMELTPEAGGSLYAHIEPGLEVVAYVDDLNNVAKLSKFELGIKPPDTVLSSIQNFLNETGYNELNPYMSDDVYIQATFKKMSYDTVYYDTDPYMPPEEVIYVDSIVVKRDAFFTKEVQRDISGFEDLYNHPYLQSSGFYWDIDGQYGGHPGGVKYGELGGGWTTSDAEYPFRIRFAPPETGTWQCIININSTVGHFVSPSFEFQVIPSSKSGYLKVDYNNRFLKRDGETFRPIGINAPWPIRGGWPLIPYGSDSSYRIVHSPQRYAQTAPIAVYEQYLRNMDTLAMNGINYFRLIMNPFTLDIEYEKLGDYTDRMHIAEEMDLILERAEQNNLLIHWNFMLHNTLQTNGFNVVEWDWSDEPYPDDPEAKPTGAYCYNTQISGVNTPLDFLANQEAKKYYKERLRYIIARWGYSPNIAMFELMSEINQIGKKYNYVDGGEVDGTNQYIGNEQIFSDWHGEMSYYLKEELKIPQLLTVSYTIDHNPELDHSFWHGNIDVINLNQYNYKTSGVHAFHKFDIPKKLANTGFGSGVNHWGNYEKPLFFSESGAHEVWKCDNFIETRRNIWQNMFWGIAGSLDWQHEILKKETQNLDIYKRVDDFTQGVDLENGNWHSGMMKRDNQGQWEYKQSYLDDCIREDELADLVYLRSGDQEKAFGVITNRRANYYTLGEGECTAGTSIAAPIHSEFDPQEEDEYTDYTQLLQSYGNIESKNGNNRLRIRNMALGFLGSPKEYKIKYYSPYDQVNSIKEETRWAPQLTLDFPQMDTLDIILFEVFPMGDDFKSATNDTISKDKAVTKRSNDELQKQEVLIYPNPNNGNFIVLLEHPETVKGIYISNNLGQVVDSRNEVFKQNRYTLNYFNSGIYSVEVVYSNKTIRKKIIIN